MSEGLVARLRARLDRPTRLDEVLVPGWGALAAAELARRRVYAAGTGSMTLGDLFEVTGDPVGRIRFEGELSNAVRLGAGLTEGEVTVEGNIGPEVGLGMSGGSIDVRGNAGPRAGAAAPEARRGMTGGELIVRGSVGEEAGSRMRRGLLVVGGSAGAHPGLGMIAGTLIVFGDAGAPAGLWSKRGSLVALGTVTIPSTYRYDCTYRPVFLRLILGRLQKRLGLRVEERHLSGPYRRYSGDLADLGRGEILAWTAE